MYAVVIQASGDMPCSSPTMVGRAVLTIVWSRAASSIASMSEPKMSLKAGGVVAAAPVSGPASAGVVDMGLLRRGIGRVVRRSAGRGG